MNLHQTTAADPVEACHLHIVGIGASAGGLEALEQMFAGMPRETGLAFVILQHLSPNFESQMDQLLGRQTDLPIRVVTDGMRVEANHIYLIPPRKEMIISGGTLLLTERDPRESFSLPIDHFFRSLAQDAGRYSIGVILSGTGSDGSRGIQEIHEAGGLVLVQSPDTARFDGMPRQAMETGVVDLVLSPAAIPSALVEYVDQALSPGNLAESPFIQDNNRQVHQILALLKKRYHLDFSQYKPTTVGRRTERRVELTGCESLEQYLQYIEHNPEELNHLYQDLLIGVTQFFRDPEAFEELRNSVFPELPGRVGDSREIRIWVAGCATGEEAYSMAILLQEQLEQNPQLTGKIFATDVHRTSLEFASRGVYSEAALENMDANQRDRWFTREGDHYQVRKELRSLVVFAPHDLISDAPFTRMDLISCRNLLIYFLKHAQEKVLSLFHFGLNTGGVLFLGASETPGGLEDEFEPISKKWRLYRKKRDIRLRNPVRLPMNTNLTAQREIPRPPTRSARAALDSALLTVCDRVLNRHLPPCFLVDGDHQILHTFGGAEQYLHFRGGRPSVNLLEVICEGLKSSIAGALQQAARENKVVRYAGIRFRTLQNEPQECSLLVEPYAEPRSRAEQFLVLLEPAQAISQGESLEQQFDQDEQTRHHIRSLESDLQVARENLQATIEELETSNEELQAANEELVASNEELQSTNEELHSVNEELYTVNTEYQKKINELTELTADMDNLLNSTDVGVLFLDRELRIRRFTPMIARRFDLLPRDQGRKFSNFSIKDLYPELLTDVQSVLKTGGKIEREIPDTAESWFFLRLLPYLSGDSVEGVVLTLIDISSLKLAEAEVTRLADMVKFSQDAIIGCDLQSRIHTWNAGAERLYGYTAEEAVGQPLAFLLPTEQRGEQGTPEPLSEDPHWFEHREAQRQCRDGSRLYILQGISPIKNPSGELIGFSSIERDITKRIEMVQSLRLYERALAAATNGVLITDCQQPDNPIVYANAGFEHLTGYTREEVLGRNCRFLQGKETSAERLQELRIAVQERRDHRTVLLNYRRDGSPFWNDLRITPIQNESGEVTHFIGVQADVTETLENLEALKSSEQQVRLLLDSTAEAIYGLDADGCCTFCNPACVTMLGYECAEELLGQEMHTLLHHTDAAGNPVSRPDCPIYRTLAIGSPYHSDTELFWRKDGSSFPVECWAHPIRDAEDRLVGSVVTFLDITERQKYQDLLEEATARAESASVTKSAFLANMSHEIRTPITTIVGLVDLLMEQQADQAKLTPLRMIQRSCSHLTDLINDILDLSRIEADKLQLEPELCSPARLLAEIASMMEVRASQKGLQLNVQFDGPVPEVISMDPVRVRQILINLIGNAVKFTESGSVVVVARLRTEAASPVMEFQVTDTGPGIPQEKLSQIFDPFTQADSSTTRRYGGTGLGLAISYRLAMALGGTLHVQSQPGEGSSFTLQLPAGELEDLKLVDGSLNWEETPEVSPAADVRLDGCRVLVAEDTRGIQYLMEKFLTSRGARVMLVENGRQALAEVERLKTERQSLDVIVMDMHMPEMDGYEAVKRLRAGGCDTPVIALTANAMTGDEEKCLAIGCDSYLAKPIDSAQLLLTIHRFLHDGKH